MNHRGSTIHLQSLWTQTEACGGLHFQPPYLTKKASASHQEETGTREIHFRRRRNFSNKCDMGAFLLTEEEALPLSHTLTGS